MTTQRWADEALAGWHAAKRGEPLDPTASAAWQEGWRTYTDRQRYSGGR